MRYAKLFTPADFELAWRLRPISRWPHAGHAKELCRKVLVDGMSISKVAETIDWRRISADDDHWPVREAEKVGKSELTRLVKETAEQIFPDIEPYD